MSESRSLVQAARPRAQVLLLDCTEATATQLEREAISRTIESHYSGDVRMYCHFVPVDPAAVLRLMRDLRDQGTLMFKEVRVFGTLFDDWVASLLGLCRDLEIPIRDHTSQAGELRKYLRWDLQINRSPTRK